MVAGVIADGALGAFSLWGALSWMCENAAGVATQTVSDGAVKNHLADRRRKLAASFRGHAASKGWFADSPRATSTNHDLLRALRAAWVRVAQQKLAAIRELHEHLRYAETVSGLPVVNIAELLGKELQRLETNAADRSLVFETVSPVETRLTEIVEAAPEQVQGEIGQDFVQDLTEAFVSGVLEIWIGWDNSQSDIKKRVEHVLREPISLPNAANSLAPGEAILNRFVENLKSGLYPEASEAYHILLNGLIRKDISKVRDDLSSLAERLNAPSDQLFESLQLLRGELAKFLDETASFQDEVMSAIRSNAQDIKSSAKILAGEIERIQLILAAPDHSLKGTVDSSKATERDAQQEFFGRDGEVEKLFSRFENFKRSLSLVTAPAGTGKSAFMAEVARRARLRGYSVVTHFITRKRQDTLETPQVLGHLALQLRGVYCRSSALPPLAVDKQSIRNEIDSYLSRPHPEQRRLLIIVDGLDTMPERLPVFVPPRDVGEGIHVVLSCRVGHPDEWPSALLAWGDATAAESFRLKSVGSTRLALRPMDNSAITVWLSKRLNDLALDQLDTRSRQMQALSVRVKELSEGLALFVSYLISDIATRISAGENIDVLLRRLKSMPPSFAEYLKAELAENVGDERPPYGSAERKFLGLAAVAMGPLWDEEFGVLVEKIDSQNPPQAVARWLSRVKRQGDNVSGWIIQHPRLAQPLKTALGSEALKAQESLVTHCKKTFEERSRYSARYAAVWGPKHLMQADDYLTATTWMSNYEILQWRLEVAPERETIRAMNSDFVELENQSVQQPAQLAAMANVFATIAPALYREVER